MLLYRPGLPGVGNQGKEQANEAVALRQTEGPGPDQPGPPYREPPQLRGQLKRPSGTAPERWDEGNERLTPRALRYRPGPLPPPDLDMLDARQSPVHSSSHR